MIYARVLNPQAGVIDVKKRPVQVFCQPQNGNYPQIEIFTEGKTLSPQTRPEARLAAGDLLPSDPLASDGEKDDRNPGGT